ncbi:septal ring lytic transglycosylase RlpA family protein [Bradyrhizobium sp. STM 3562]|uniref:septal ring lytic transglycosylase RlpA family protein n=1 Tax=Bradyrhizobium sp. STM 3562 TaxID=578924 RepID=UPI00388F970A
MRISSVAGVRRLTKLSAVGLSAAWLAACAQSSVVSNSLAPVAPTRQAALGHHQNIHVATHARVKLLRRTAIASEDNTRRKKPGSQGMASFYTEGSETASGEKFDAHELTAAHPTLPFGTRLRVTNVATGRSVTVRVNDRGPYVAGRVVDVSQSAAEALGMVDQGVAKVKLDVVQ